MRRSVLVALVLSLFVVVACSEDEETPEETNPCSVVNGGLVDACPEGSFCHQTGNDAEGEPTYACVEGCSTDDDCAGDLECYDQGDEGRRSCGERRPVCVGDASLDDCECSFKSSDDSDPVFVVQGTGDDCEIVSREATACYRQEGTCLNSCVDQFWRYELGDGTAILFRGLQGGISDGWSGDGQGDTPDSCPALAGEYPLRN